MSKLTVKGIKGMKQVAHVVYDFAKDGGAFGTPIDLFDLSADTIIHNAWFEVETAVTSLAGATLEVGITGGDTDGIFTQAAKTVYAIDVVSADSMLGALLKDGTEKNIIRKKVTAATTISLLIGTAALTAGKVHFYLETSSGY